MIESTEMVQTTEQIITSGSIKSYNVTLLLGGTTNARGAGLMLLSRFYFDS